MELDKFDESNSTIGHGDDKFDVHIGIDEECSVVVCWKLGFWERIWALITGRVWQHSLTYGDGLQTTAISISKPEME